MTYDVMIVTLYKVYTCIHSTKCVHVYTSINRDQRVLILGRHSTVHWLISYSVLAVSLIINSNIYELYL